jgi:alkylhydroperoxidase family enzyme
MSRIELVDTEEFTDELRARLGNPDDVVANGHLRVIAHWPKVAAAWLDLLAAMRDTGTLDPRLVEIVRLRIAYHNQCAHCMAVRFGDDVEETLVCELNNPATAEDLSDAERAALAYADKLCTDHLNIEDADFDALREHFTESQLVELSFTCAIFLGPGRVSRGWQVIDGLDPKYAGEGHMELDGDGVRVGAAH